MQSLEEPTTHIAVEPQPSEAPPALDDSLESPPQPTVLSYTTPDYIVSAPDNAGRNPGGGSEQPPEEPSKNEYFTPFHYNRLAFLVTLAAVILILLLSGAWLLLAKDHSASNDAQNSAAPGKYRAGTSLQLKEVPGDQLQVGTAQQLDVNGLLRANDTFVVAPTSQPSSPVAGQIYYDKTTNTLYYYNGQQFVSLTQANGVTSLGGANGTIGLGNGLVMSGGQLSISNTLLQQISSSSSIGSYVASLQGQTGNVTLGAGSGISINGTTISNGGVIGLAAGSPNLTITSDGNGHYTISAASASGITGSGTAGHIAKFDGASSITDSSLTESGTTLTYGGNFIVNAASGFSGNLINLEVNGSSKLTVDQSGDSVQAGTLTVNGTGTSSIAGSLSIGTGLTVTTGGATVTGNSVINGTLSGLTGLTSGGTITFSGLTPGGVVHNNASGVLSTGPVQLGVDTTGNYVAQLGTLTGLTTTGNSGSGSTPTLSVTYGDIAGTAVQGNTTLTVSPGTGLNGGGTVALGAGGTLTLNVQYGSSAGTAVAGNTTLTCPTGTDNLQGGGNVVTLGAGGSCNNITISNSPTFTGTLTVQGSGGIVVGASGIDGTINLLNSSNANVTTIKTAAVGQNQTITIPDSGLASDEVCLVALGNCAGSGGGIVGSGTAGHLSKFNSATSITDSGLVESGSTLTYSGNVVIQGSNSLSLGTSNANTGALTFNNSSNANTLTLQAGATGGNLTLTLPTAYGNDGDCLMTNSLGVLSFQACTGGAGGGVTSLDGQIGIVTLANSSGAGGVVTINNAKADASTKGIAAFNATNFNDNGSGIINTIQDISTTSTPTFGGLTLSAPLAVASGGTGANNFTLNGILYGNGTSPIQATSAAADSVLATDSSNVPHLVQTLPMAVQGNITQTGALSSGSITSGFGNISTGNLISTTASLHGGTLSAGTSNQFQVDASGNATTIGTLAVQGAGGITVGVAGTTPGVINLANGTNSNLSILQAAAPTGTGNATYSLPSIAGGTSDDICLKSLGNCSSGGTIGGGGTLNHIAKFSPDGTHIADSNLVEVGTTLTYSGNLVVNAGTGFTGNLINLEVNGSSKLSVDQNGNTIQAGTLSVNGTGASSIAGTLSVGTLGTNGTTSLCSNAGVISSCASTGTQGFWTRTGTTLQPANAGDDVTTSGNISTTGTGGITSAGNFVANGTALFKNSADSPTAFQVQNSGGSNLIVADTANSKVGINTGALALNTNLNVYNGQPSTTQTDFTQNLSRAGINFMTDYVQDAYTGGIFWSTQNNNASSPKAGIYTQETNSGSKLLFGTSGSYSAGLTNTALTLGYNGEAIFRNGFNTPTGFQIQNAIGTGLFTVDTTTGATLTSSLFVDTLGTGGTTAVCWNGSLQISSCASTGSIGFWNRTGTDLQPANAGDSVTVSGTLTGLNTVWGTRSSPTNAALAATVTGDTFARYQVLANGTTQWGSGTAAADTNLYRGAVGQLNTDSSFYVNGATTSAGLLTGNAGLTVTGGAANINASGTGAVTIGNASSGAVAVQSGSTIAITAGTSLNLTSTGSNAIGINPGGGSNTGVVVRPATDTTNLFQIQNAATGASLLNVDSVNSNITLLGNDSGAVGPWQTASNALPAARITASSVVANGYVYVIGGNNGSTPQSTVYYAKLNSDGSVGTWNTATNALPATVYQATSVAANGYVYVMGGVGSSTVYYAKLNSDGSVGTWNTASNALPGNRQQATSIAANGYVYVIGGSNGTIQSTVYYAKLNSDGSVGTWNTASNALPGARVFATSAVSNGYVYELGGSNSSFVPQSTVYYAKLNSDGSVGTWNTASNALPDARINATSVVSNGYLYELGGANGSGTAQSTVYYTSTPRLQVGGSLDLVGLQGSNLADGDSQSLGSVGGNLTAGDTNIVGTLQVQGAANFSQSVAINGTLNVGSDVTITNTSAKAFQVQDASNNSVLSVDTTNKRVQIGSAGTPTSQLFVSGSAPAAATGSVTPSAPNGLQDIATQGNYAYTIDYSGSLFKVVDISNPASPTNIGSVATSSHPQTMAVAGRYAYVGEDTAHKLEIFDISNPTSPSLTGSLDVTNGVLSIVVSGKYAYVGAGSTIKVVDISNPAAPSLVSSFSVSTPLSMFISGRYLYTVDNGATGTFRVIDISNPASLSTVGSVSTGGQSSCSSGSILGSDNIYVSGRYAYVTVCSTNTVKIFDVSNPASPAAVGSGISTGSSTGPIAINVQGRYAYVALYSGNQFGIFDVSNPASPSLIGITSTGTSSGPLSLTVQGRYAYVADWLDSGGGKINIYDLGGSYIQQLEAGGTQTGTLAVGGNSTFAGDLNAAGSLQVGQNAEIDGNLGVGGQALFKNATNSSTAFQIQNSSGLGLFTADTSGMNIIMQSGYNGATSAWASTVATNLPAREGNSSVIANGYIYMFGGYNGGGQADVYYTKVNANGSTNSWTATTSLPGVADGNRAVFSNGYIYVFSGSSTQNVYYAKPNVDGTISSWTTLSGVLPAAQKNTAGVAANNGYIYWIGGSNGSSTTGVTYAKQNPDGSLGTFTSTASLPLTRDGVQAVIANGYIYIFGGYDSSGNAQKNVYRSQIASNGSLGTWSDINNDMPANRQQYAAAFVNGYVYIMGGMQANSINGTAVNTVFYAHINADGSMGSWTTSANTLPDKLRWVYADSANGYIYTVDGDNGSGAGSSPVSAVYYTSVSRVQVAGSLDLVGINGGNLADSGGNTGSTGGSLTAGDTNIVGALQVQGMASFAQGVNISGNLTVGGTVAIKTATNSTTAFQIQNSGGTALLTADTTTNTLTVSTLVVSGNLTVNGHIITGGSTPTRTVGATNTTTGGTGATCTVAGTDTSGVITFVAGTGTTISTTGTLCTITFSNAFGATPRVVLGAGDTNGAKSDPYVTSVGTGSFAVANSFNLTQGQTYTFFYIATQ